MIPVALLFFAAATHVDLVDEDFHIPAGEWRYVELGLRQKAALVSANFQVRSGSHQIRLALMRREDLERLRDDRPHGVLAATEPEGGGTLRYPVRVPGDYVLLIDNRAGTNQAADAHLRVALDFGIPAGQQVTGLSATRQIVVVALSFAVFFAIAGYSARRLIQGIKR